jgi:hypothetical protein
MEQRNDALGGLVLAHGDDDPPVFYGPPGQLRGRLRLTNPTDEKLKLARIALAAGNLTGVARGAVGELQLAARLAPGEQESAQGTIALDPRTPPGTYEGHLLLGDREQAVVLHVVDHIDLRISPEVVYVFTDGERVFERQFVVENAGNVPIRLGERCAATLVDQLERRAALRDAAQRTCAEDVPEPPRRDGAGELPARDVLRDVLCGFERQQLGPVLLDRPDETLKPGEIRAGAAKIMLPGGLQSHRRYEARLRLYNASVTLDVTTGRISDTRPDEPEGGGLR